MHTFSTWFLYWQWLLSILSLGAAAAAGLPGILILTLLAGRRGNARLCAFGAGRMARLAFRLAPLGIVCTLGEHLGLLVQLRGPAGLTGLYPLHPVMLPATTAVLAWLAGMVCLFFYLKADAAAPLPALPPVDQRRAKGKKIAPDPALSQWEEPEFRSRLCLALAALICFFTALTLPRWPFAGLPQGMELSTAAQAVLSTSLHDLFAALGPAGAAALLVLTRLRKGPEGTPLETDALRKAGRWCALWAFLGYIPRCLDRWGLFVGISMRPGPLPPDVAADALGLTPLTLAIACWILIFALRAPRRILWLNFLAIFFLLVRQSLPFVLRLAQ
ncbi:spidroin-2 [Desulfovibrio legallii]|uniref:spidroin-2 n=1 Tax=Desulfovibrio legallii TaxID=571438 RepID=UPI003A9297CB